MTVHFVSAGSIDQVSGGYRYNRCLLEQLRRNAVDVIYHADPRSLRSTDAGDILIVDSIALGGLIGPLLRSPAQIVLLLHVVPSLAPRGTIDPRLLRALCRRSLIVVTGLETLDRLREQLADHGLGAIKIEPGIPDRWRQKRRYAERAVALLGVSNYVDGKGLIDMLDVLHRLQHLPWRLTLHGNKALDPAYFADVAQATTAFGLADRVELLGPVPHHTINAKMVGSDLLLHFSHSESYSMVTAEAIACGLPVISYRTGNHTAFGRSGLVQYVDRDGRSEIATLEELMRDGTIYRRLRAGTRPPLRSWRAVGREFLACLNRARAQ